MKKTYKGRSLKRDQQERRNERGRGVPVLVPYLGSARRAMTYRCNRRRLDTLLRRAKQKRRTEASL